jgi:hypothetical protein
MGNKRIMVFQIHHPLIYTKKTIPQTLCESKTRRLDIQGLYLPVVNYFSCANMFVENRKAKVTRISRASNP